MEMGGDQEIVSGTRILVFYLHNLLTSPLFFSMVEIAERIPKSPSGMILRRILVERERRKRA